MYPHERSLVKRLADKPFALIGINTDSKQDVKDAIKRENITWRSFWDGGSNDGPIVRKLDISSFPTTYVLDHRGIIRFQDLYDEELDQAVDQLLTELKSENEKRDRSAP